MLMVCWFSYDMHLFNFIFEFKKMTLKHCDGNIWGATFQTVVSCNTFMTNEIEKSILSRQMWIAFEAS